MFISRPRKHTIILAVIVLCFIGVTYLHIPLDRDIFSSRNDVSLKITDRHGIVLREVLSAEGGHSTWLSYDEIPETVIQAVLSAEDKRFFSHGGVDWLAFGRAMIQNLAARRIVSGASTITQQVIKNRFGLPRTVLGKVREMVLAIRLEHTLSKQEIFEQYINRVEFSNLAFGIEAAANVYFRKPASHLSLAESVFLAGLIQAPSRLNPYRELDRAKQRQQLLLERMHIRQIIGATTYRIARHEELRLTPKKVNFKAPHFCEMVLSSGNSLGITPRAEKSDQLKSAEETVLASGRIQQGALASLSFQSVGLAPGGTIPTTLDYYLQEAVEDIVSIRIGELKDYNVTNAAVLVLDNRNGEILAYVGSKDFFDDSISGQVDGVQALRQPGSTLKPFMYQLALERSYTAATLLPDIQDYPSAPRSFLPENYDRKFHGPVRLRQALACSYNVPAVRVLESIGVETLYDRLHAYGMQSLKELPSFYGPGLTLGNGEVTLLELTHAYSILARRGESIHLQYLTSPSIEYRVSSLQSPVPSPQSPVPSPQSPVSSPQQLFSPYSSYLITHILADRQAAVPAFGEDTPLKLPFPTAVKTGTSKDYRDNWTVGYTPEYTVGVWVGNFDASSMQRVSGISGAAPIYRDVMLHLYKYYDPPSLFAEPLSELTTIQICPVSGKLVGDDCPHALEEVFLKGTEPTEACDMHQAYWVDSRDGLLTSPDSVFAVKKTFVHFPPMYQAWAREAGYPQPPTRYSPYMTSTAEHKNSKSMHIQIVHPNHGDVYAIDPILRREYQTIQLSAIVPPEISQITWYVDDEIWEESVEIPFEATWPIRVGTHRMYVEGWHAGEVVRSQEIRVHVIE